VIAVVSRAAPHVKIPVRPADVDEARDALVRLKPERIEHGAVIGANWITEWYANGSRYCRPAPPP
jgi:hypothetical protein